MTPNPGRDRRCPGPANSGPSGPSASTPPPTVNPPPSPRDGEARSDPLPGGRGRRARHPYAAQGRLQSESIIDIIFKNFSTTFDFIK